ncbi:flagellar biosynthetic protein FliO [Myxococcus stipitatus]|uniref:FliO/MopB family protein n=1 Tax=Myxococcus stipitatus TaxID=83455 RepID=UPI001F165300|nr:flagellar biosynthetic protein FliO [Myxococcus stipitatus]MCE9666637.1 flagellar biosynthetic protein FliO [Myxococcus stipitatus]
MAVIRNPLIRLSLGAVLVCASGAAMAQAQPPAAATPSVAPAKPPEPSVAPAKSPAVAAPPVASEKPPAVAAPSAPSGAPPAVATSPAAPEPDLTQPRSSPEPSPWKDELDLEGAKEEPESMGWMLVRTLFVLGAVVASIYLTLNVGLRRLMGLQGTVPGKHTVVSVVERLTLDPKRSLFVVKAADEYLLVGGGEAGLQLLSKLDTEAVERIRAQASPPNVVPLSPFLQKLLSRRSGGSSSQPPGT